MILHFSNGESYTLENRVVALLRTNYFSKTECIEKDTEEWENLFNESLREDNVEDWFLNNIDFEDIKDSLEIIKVNQTYYYIY